MKKSMWFIGVSVLVVSVWLIGCNEDSSHDNKSQSNSNTSFRACPYDVEDAENDLKNTYNFWCNTVRNGLSWPNGVDDLGEATRRFSQGDIIRAKILKHKHCQLKAIKRKEMVVQVQSELMRFNERSNSASAPFSCKSIFYDSDEEQQADTSDDSDPLYNGCERNCMHLDVLCHSAGLLEEKREYGQEDECRPELEECLSQCRK